jgi:hypothetical protein
MVKKSHYLVERLQSMQNKRVKVQSSSDTLLTEEEIPQDVHVSFEAAHSMKTEVTEGGAEEETVPAEYEDHDEQYSR